jgi:diguanylate cyclase (GGDEF)-like protein
VQFPPAAATARRASPFRRLTNSRIGPSGVERPPRLVLRFAISTAVLLAVGAFVILIFFRQHAIAQAESAAVFHSRFVVRSVLGDRLRPGDFARPVGPDRRAMLDSVVQSDVLVGDSRLLELYSRDGRVTYSSTKRLVGTVPKDAAKARSTLASSDVAKAVETVDGHRVLKVFVPVPFIGSDEPAGVLALAQDYGPISQAGRKGLLPVVGVLQLVLITLYLSLFPLLYQVTRRLRAQVEEIEKLALFDALTGLANRRLFHDRLEQAFLHAQRSGTGFALMLLDLDRFKEINDTLGHQTGDAVLKHLAKRLRDVARASDTVARLGGDEFALILDGAQDSTSALFVAERIRRALDDPFVVDGITLQLETSIGIAIFPQHGNDAEELLKRADISLYASKDSHQPVVYETERDRHTAESLGLPAQVRKAIENGELTVHYQPEIDLASGETTRLEALVRWNHPERGLLLPDSFIPLARQSALVRPITRYVLDAALSQCRAWQDAGIHVGVAVNLAGRDLDDSRLEEEVAEALRRWRVEPKLLELEVPESAIMSEREHIHKMLERLSERGVRLAVDDFGSGHGSLSQLKQLPVDVLKVDRSFVQNVGTNDEDDAIVRSTIDLAHSLGIAVVAKGVESEVVLQRLRALGCDLAQGFCLARPAPGPDLTEWLRGRKSEAA